MQTIDATLRKTLEDMRANSEISRKTEVEKRLDYLQDNYKHYIEEELKKQFAPESYESIKIMVDDSVNIIDYVTGEVASLYNGEAVRKLSVESKRYEDLKKTLMINLVMKEINRYTFALNECVSGILVRDKQIYLDILPPNYVSVLQDENDPRTITALMYEVCLTDSVMPQAVSVQKKTKERHFVYWDVYGNHFKMDENYNIIPNAENPDNENPYKDARHPGRFILPFTIYHRNYNVNTIWDGTSGGKLYSAQLQISVLLSLLNYYTKVLSVKQYYVTGNAKVDATNKQLLDPLHVFKVIGEGAQVGVLDMQGDLDKVENIIIGKIDRILNQFGLSLESFQKKGTPESGYKLKIKREPLQKRIDDQKPMFRIYEAEQFEKIRIVNNTYALEYGWELIPENAEFSIDFAEYQSDEDPTITDKHRSFELANNLKTPIDYIREDNPDIDSDEKAREKFEDNKRINGELLNDTNKIENGIAGAIDETNQAAENKPIPPNE